MTIKKQITNITAIIWVSVLIIVSAGCSQTNETGITEVDNTNQSNAISSNTALSNSPNTNMPSAENVPAPTASNSNASTTASADNQKMKKDKQSPPVTAPTPVIGSGGQDFFLITKARGILNSDKELADSVVVEVKEGAATLTGNVSSEAQKEKAEKLIKEIKEMKSVKNNIRVSSNK